LLNSELGGVLYFAFFTVLPLHQAMCESIPILSDKRTVAKCPAWYILRSFLLTWAWFWLNGAQRKKRNGERQRFASSPIALMGDPFSSHSAVSEDYSLKFHQFVRSIIALSDSALPGGRAAAAQQSRLCTLREGNADPERVASRAALHS
jgi:hypothetical protein